MKIPQEYLSALKEAQNRLGRNDAPGAIHIGEQLLRVIPKHPGVHVVLGRAYARSGQIDQSLVRLKTATDLVPQDPGLWNEFVTALLKVGQKARARKMAQKAPLKGPEKKKLLELAKSGEAPSIGPTTGGASIDDIRRLQTLMQNGQPAVVRQEALNLLKQHPESSALHNLAGVAAMASNDLDAALAHFRRTLELAPKFVGAKVNLGMALARKKEFSAAILVLAKAATDDAFSLDARIALVQACVDGRQFAPGIVHAEKLLSLSKDHPEGLKLLASALIAQERFDEAHEAIDRFEKVHGSNEQSLLLRFDAFSEAGRFDEAQALAQREEARAPELRRAKAVLLGQLGRLEDARRELADLLKSGHKDLGVFYQYGVFTKWREDDPLLSSLQAEIDTVAPGTDESVQGHYALAKACFDIGRDEDGLGHLRSANDQQRLTYSVAAAEAKRRRIQKRWSAEAIWRLRSVGDNSVAPIFIVGTPRSGSTLLENVISAHPDVSTIGEDSFTTLFFPYEIEANRDILAAAAKDAAEQVRRISGSNGILLDKLLHNFMRVGALAAAFPRGRFIQTVRDPRAVAWSIYSNYFNASHEYATKLEDIGHFFNVYLGFMAHWQSVVGDRIILHEYEKAVSDPEPVIRSLIERLDLEWDDACLRPEAVQKQVKTLSTAQVRSGINTRAKERWRRYESELDGFTTIVSRTWDFAQAKPRYLS